MLLATRHAHARDQNIVFYEETHTYVIVGQVVPYRSVSAWVHSLFTPFDAPSVIATMMAGPRYKPGHAYWGKTPAEIQAGWEAKGAAAAAEGTRMHADIEAAYNVDTLPPAYTHADMCLTTHPLVQFADFVHATPTKRPFRTEWRVYDDRLPLCGTIDMVYLNDDGTLSIYDWKRTADMVKTSPFQKRSPVLPRMEDTNYWHYAMQLNLYAYVVEHNYGYRVSELCLVQLHPNNEHNTYQLHPVPRLDAEVATALNSYTPL